MRESLCTEYIIILCSRGFWSRLRSCGCGWQERRQSGFRRALPAIGCALLLLVGCRSDPYNVVPVSGKVAYRDGSRIAADRIVVRFVPQTPADAKGPVAAASGEANVTDGSFSGLTTHKYLDGAIVGRHKVLVLAFKKGPAKKGFPEMDFPTNAVPRKYSMVESTPLEVNVARSGESFDLLIDK